MWLKPQVCGGSFLINGEMTEHLRKSGCSEQVSRPGFRVSSLFSTGQLSSEKSPDTDNPPCRECVLVNTIRDLPQLGDAARTGTW